MTDEQKDPTEREREDEDLEMDEEQAEDVKGGLLEGGTSLSMTKLSTTSPTTSTTSTTDPTIKLGDSTTQYPTRR